MKFLSRLFFSFISNIVALWVAVYFVSGFEIVSIQANPLGFLTVALIFTLLNTFLRPILKLVFGPIIVLTLGLGIILLNMFILYLLPLFSSYIKISGLLPLFYATLIIGLVNLFMQIFSPDEE